VNYSTSKSTSTSTSDETGPWADWLIIVIQCCDTVGWWLGHTSGKIVSEMTYNVSSGTSNPIIPIAIHRQHCLGHSRSFALILLLQINTTPAPRQTVALLSLTPCLGYRKTSRSSSSSSAWCTSLTLSCTAQRTLQGATSEWHQST